jgi:antitoxin YefM
MAMNAVTYATVRSNLSQTMEQVCNDHEPVVITRHKKQAVVLMSLEDYRSIEETAYLLRSPENAKRLMQSINELEVGGGIKRELLN